MKINALHTFIGAKNFDVSRRFYRELGFKEVLISEKMSFFEVGKFGFYLQDHYVKEWADNSMLFMEIDDLEKLLGIFKKLSLSEKYEGVRLSEIKENDWGNEFFLHDPSGILWHFGKFK